MMEEGFERRENRGILGQFLFVGGILFVGVLLPSVILEKQARIDVPKKKDER